MLHEHPGGLELTEQLIKLCGFSPGAKVLDIGCGIGTTVEYLRDVWKLQAVGVDISETRLVQGWNRTPGLPLLQAPGDCLPFADATMDGVIAECSISVMGQAEAVLAETERILNKNGILAITDVYARNEAGGLDPGYKTCKEWQELLLEHGFFLRCWEDRSNLLPAFLASLIMEQGILELGLESIKKVKPGYFLIMAKKATREDE